jgi:hypothetical protein
MAVSVLSHTTWSISHGEQLIHAPDHLVQTLGGEAFVRLMATNRQLCKLVAAGHVESFQSYTNPTLAGNTGLKMLVGLRNTASGLVVEKPYSRLLDAASEEPAAKKPRKAKSSRPQAVDADGAGDEVVTFQVEGYEGVVRAKKALLPTEDLVVALNGSVLNIVFGIILAHGVDLNAANHYNKTGRYSKAHHASPSHEADDSQPLSSASDITAIGFTDVSQP